MSHVWTVMKQWFFLPAIASAAIVVLIAGCDDGAAPSGSSTIGTAATSADTVSMEFDVKGMFCEGCVFSVRSAIAGLDGVESCDVSLADEIAVVVVNDEATERAIIEAIEKLDFTISRRGSATVDAPDAGAAEAGDLADG